MRIKVGKEVGGGSDIHYLPPAAVIIWFITREQGGTFGVT